MGFVSPSVQIDTSQSYNVLVASTISSYTHNMRSDVILGHFILLCSYRVTNAPTVHGFSQDQFVEDCSFVL